MAVALSLLALARGPQLRSVLDGPDRASHDSTEATLGLVQRSRLDIGLQDGSALGRLAQLDRSKRGRRDTGHGGVVSRDGGTRTRRNTRAVGERNPARVEDFHARLAGDLHVVEG